MRIVWYLLTALFGLIGALALIRTVERFATGVGSIPAQLVIAFVMLLLAVLCVREARAVTRCRTNRRWTGARGRVS